MDLVLSLRNSCFDFQPIFHSHDLIQILIIIYCVLSIIQNSRSYSVLGPAFVDISRLIEKVTSCFCKFDLLIASSCPVHKA